MRRYLIYIVLFVATAATLTSCGEDDPLVINEPGVVNFTFNHTVDGTPLKLNAVQYANDAGNVYSVTKLKYYVTNIILTKTDGVTHAPRSYYLVDADFVGGADFRMIDIPAGDYKSISFSIGVDPVANVNGDQQGALDPLNGMFWSWNTGYIFTKLEGKYVNGIGDETNYLYHIGLDSNRIDMTIPLNFSMAGKSPVKTVNVEVDVNKFFNGTYTYDIEKDGDVTHTSNYPLVAFKIRENMKNAFKVSLAN